MDRRRFVPSPEGLEGRALLSTTTASANRGLFGLGGNLSTSNDNIPETFEAKLHRIEHLPYYLEKIRPGRFLPAGDLNDLQVNMLSIAGQLHWPGPGVLDAFNQVQRDIQGHTSLSAADASQLNRTFGNALSAAGASPQTVANFQADLNDLARSDAQGPQPAFLATNDYALILQTILGVDRPIERPTAPQLKVNTGIRVNPNYAITGREQPIMVGTYDAAQDSASKGVTATTTTIEIVDANGKVYGTAPIDSNGDYSVQFAAPLGVGVHEFYVRAKDAEGHLSNFSPPFKVKVIARAHEAAETLTPPQGPLGTGR